jgi:predicted nucleotidyltransferase
MSGNFVQRGEPALIDKWTRTKMALENGIDLVLELPVIYSVSSAEFFSQGAVSILSKLGVINNISFGSECGDIDILKYIAQILVNEPEDYKEILKTKISSGLPFPVARSKALVEYTNKSSLNFNIEAILNSSNNILGIEYCKSLLKNHSSIIPYTIQRQGGSYNSKDLNLKFSSATAIRELIRTQPNLEALEAQLPPGSFSIVKSIFSKYKFIFPQDMYIYLKYKILQNYASMKKLPDIEEGLDNRIYSSIFTTDNYDELINSIKTKRYTYTRLARCLCQYFIGFELFNTAVLRNSPPKYTKVLGFTKKGAEILKFAKKRSDIDIYTKLPHVSSPMLDLDILSTKMYSVLNSSVSPDDDYKISPIIYK